ncbi:MAG: replicative DNA helicase [Gammaproteobacteria bacterium]|nr:replicative DNA helicase [Gammaproteobacteria bacterium]
MLESVTNKSVRALKTPPHSHEAEQSLLGGLLISKTSWDQIADRLTNEDFYHPPHRIIFTALNTLSDRDKPLDALTLTELLKDQHQLDKVGGESYIYELAKNTVSAANITAYADIIRERSILRQLVEVAAEVSSTVFDRKGRDASDILDEAERKVFSIAEQKSRGSGPQSISHILAQTMQYIDKIYQQGGLTTGMPTGFYDLDKMTAGLQPSDLIIIAGRPSMGKTTFAINIAENIAIKEKKPALIFSMEMSSEQLTIRMLSSWGGIEQQRLRTGQLNNHDWDGLMSANSRLSEAPLFIDDTSMLNPTELRARARRVMKEQGQLGLIVVDYLQLMHSPDSKENRATEVSQISRSLKALAKELNVPLIALSQLNRGLEQRQDKRPVMSDLRESGSLEQDADLIMFIYRDSVYNDANADKNKAEIIIGKQRNGPIGRMFLRFEGNHSRFLNIDAMHQEQDFS